MPSYIKSKDILIVVTMPICFVMLSVFTASAQGSRPSRAVERRVDTMNRQGEQLERDAQRKDMEGKSDNSVDKKRTQQILAQVKEDFERIQDTYNRIVVAMSGKNSLDYKFVAESAADVKKRAERLKSNLALPQSEDEDKSKKTEDVELNEEQLKPSLMSLRNYIYSFLTNPQFESPAAIDLELSKKASRDLNQIIKLSDSIHKCADKLKK